MSPASPSNILLIEFAMRMKASLTFMNNCAFLAYLSNLIIQIPPRNWKQIDGGRRKEWRGECLRSKMLSPSY
jgi:hypothetical protein